MAKPAFDPNKPFQSAEAQAPAAVVSKPAFDPNKPFQPGEDDGPSLLDAKLPFDTTPRGIIQGGLNALPIAGMLGGGVVGAGGGPLTSVGGAALGGAGGEALKNLGEKYLLGQEKTRDEVYGNPVKGLLEGATNEMGGQAIGAGLKAAANSPIGKKVIGGVGGAVSKVASSLSGVPQKEIETYAKNASEINAYAKAHDNDTQEMADQLRKKFNDSIQARKAELNNGISSALKTNSTKISIDPVITKLEAAKGQINAKLRPEEVEQVNALIAKAKSLSKDGTVSLSDAHDLKEYLMEMGQGSYQKGGQIFNMGDKASRAAKAGAAQARELVNKAAPQVAEANNGLAELHDIQDVMNRNILAEGKPAASLMAAGAGENPANVKILKKLGEATGTDMLGDAEKMATARTFGRPSLLPVDTTGKSLTRMGVAGGAGFLMGGLPGAIATEGLASPAAIKAAINTGRKAAPVLSNTQMRGLLLKRSGLLLNPAAPGLLENQDQMRMSGGQ